MTGSPPSSREWDAAAYHRLSGPQASWGAKVVARLHLDGHETVLDAGCGTGRLTANLVEALPRGRVFAVDLSVNMLREARTHLAAVRGAQVCLLAADLSDLPFENSLDGIFSTASFHWVLDHARLFRSLYRALRPGGWLVAQCGGGANLVRLRERMASLCQSDPFRAFLDRFREPWFYSDAETAAANLRRAGFEQVVTSLERAPTRFDHAGHFIEFVRTAIVHPHLRLLPDPDLQQSFLQALADQSAHDHPPYELDYWRLNLQARKPAE